MPTILYHQLGKFPGFLVLLMTTTCLVLSFLLFRNGFASETPTYFNPTPDEKQWLQSHPKIRIAGPRAFPPFHFYNDDLKQQGIGADYASLVFRSIALETEVIPNLPWPEVLELIKKKQIDVIVLAAKTKEREAFLEFTDPYLSFPLVIISKKQGEFIGGLEDLYQKRVTCVNKVSSCTWLKEKISSFQAVSAGTPLEALKKVAYNKADAHIENLAAASFLIQREGLSNLKIAAPTSFGSYNLHFAVRKDWPLLTSIINKSLARIPPEEKIKIQNRWLTVRYEHGIKLSDVQKWTAFIIGTAALLIMITLLWNRRLQKEIAEKDRIRRALQESLENIKTLNGLLPICASCKKIRDDTGYWNQLESYIEKHSDALFSHGICPECADKLYGKEPWYRKKTGNR